MPIYNLTYRKPPAGTPRCSFKIGAAWVELGEGDMAQYVLPGPLPTLPPGVEAHPVRQPEPAEKPKPESEPPISDFKTRPGPDFDPEIKPIVESETGQVESDKPNRRRRSIKE